MPVSLWYVVWQGDGRVSAACDLLIGSSLCCCRMRHNSANGHDCRPGNRGFIDARPGIESRGCMPHIVEWQHSMEETKQGLKHQTTSSGSLFYLEREMGKEWGEVVSLKTCIGRKGNEDDVRGAFIHESVCIKWA